MLLTDEYINMEDYPLRSPSSDSCYDSYNSSPLTDFNSMDISSDEDFKKNYSNNDFVEELPPNPACIWDSPLSPLCLDSNDDQLNMLNNFLSNNSEETSDIFPHNNNIIEEYSDFDDLFNIIPEQFDIVKLEDEVINACESFTNTRLKLLEDELKLEPLSPNPNVTTVLDDQKELPLQNSTPKQPVKRVPIQPKRSLPVLQNKKILLLKKPRCIPAVTSTNNVNSSPPRVVVLENVTPITNVTPVPITSVAPVTPINPSIITNSLTASPVILNTNNNLAIKISNIDTKALKRQQRKIKNRESACLSRKRKKDYLTSLENRVKELTSENDALKLENSQLKEKLSHYETSKQKNINAVKTIALCAFFVTLLFNVDILSKSPWRMKKEVSVIENNIPYSLDRHSRNLLWTPDESSDQNNTHFSSLTMCPAAINQTESARLVLELERWIGKPKKPIETSINVSEMNSRSAKIRPPRRKRKISFSSELSLSQRFPPTKSTNELQVFSPTPEQMYSKFFEAINRQDDTFYVVSLSDHNMLLPALHHNETRRPKMSLIMPSVYRSENMTKSLLVPLMQIDCEVLDTRLIQIQYGSIPVHLRNASYGDPSVDRDKDATDTQNANYTNKKAYKPYFINHNSVKTNEDFYNVH